MIKLVKTALDGMTHVGDLAIPLEGGSLICTACGHRCQLRPGQRGICKVRFNDDGRLMVPFDYSAGLQNDPIEKKPFFHVLPGSMAMSFGMLGCDFKCAYCQNWFTSQTLRDDSATLQYNEITPQRICDLAEQAGSNIVVSTYNEPLITSEWAVAVFREAKARGMLTAYVSNGHGTPEVLEYLEPWLDLYKVDLKCFDEKKYRRLGGNLPEVLETLRRLPAMGFWVEIVTLVVPDYNDSDRELAEIAEFIASVSVDIPWHVTGFYPTYKMTDRGRTPAGRLQRARQIGLDAGLRFVYTGNRPGQVDGSEDTYCPDCGAVLVKRCGYQVVANGMEAGACRQCGCELPGRWILPERQP